MSTPAASDLATDLDAFRAIASPGPYAYAWAHHHRGRGAHAAHAVFGFIIHGNESGTVPAALRLVRALRDGDLDPGGPVTILLGNPEAARTDLRFTEEDLNRVFTFDRPADSHERRRAEAIRPILDDADLFLDFHQTQTPTQNAFWTFPWDARFGHWARIVRAAPVGLTRPAGQVFSKGTCCLDEYVRGRGEIGITVELGERGPDPRQADAAFDAVRRVVAALDAMGGLGDPVALAARAATEPEITWYQTAHVVAARDTRDRLRPGVTNWMPVAEDERLSAEGTPELRAPGAGVVLFPKYPAPGDPPPPELFRIGQPIADPDTLG